MSNKLDRNTGRSQKSMLVFNLSPVLNINELVDLFKTYGEVIRVKSYYIPWKMKTFNCKVWFESEESCAKAVSDLNKAELDGQILNVIFN